MIKNHRSRLVTWTKHSTSPLGSVSAIPERQRQPAITSVPKKVSSAGQPPATRRCLTQKASFSSLTRKRGGLNWFNMMLWFHFMIWSNKTDATHKSRMVAYMPSLVPSIWVGFGGSMTSPYFTTLSEMWHGPPIAAMRDDWDLCAPKETWDQTYMNMEENEHI